MEYAYIFDFDGVLADTMAAHFAAYSKALEEYGVPIDRAQFYRQAGMTGREQIQYFAAKAGVHLDADAVYRRKREVHVEFAGYVQAIASNLELLRALKAAGARVAVASGSSRDSVLPAIESLGIQADVIVTAEDVERGKPNPDLFLLTARRLGVPPERCTVIEDSQAGVQAARAANMKVLHFENNRQETQPATDAPESFSVNAR